MGDKGKWCVWEEQSHGWSLSIFLGACLCGCVCCMLSMGEMMALELVHAKRGGVGADFMCWKIAWEGVRFGGVCGWAHG